MTTGRLADGHERALSSTLPYCLFEKYAALRMSARFSEFDDRLHRDWRYNLYMTLQLRTRLTSRAVIRSLDSL